MIRIVWLVLCIFLAGCSSGAVVFAPTPSAQDEGLVRYTHPSGAFSVNVPRGWALYEQNTTTLASAAFSLPNDSDAAVIFAVINTAGLIDSVSFLDLVTRYQTQIRSDVDEYTEVSREAMGDGSWRMAGHRRVASGYQSVNTFMQYDNSMIGLVEVNVSENAAKMAQITQVMNTFTINTQAATTLETSELNTLTFAKGNALAILHVTAWTTSDGVFFVSGEVANYGLAPVSGVPVEVQLFSSDGRAITGAVDTVMAHSILPGGFAPFALRFGEGQPTLATEYAITLGGEMWEAPTESPEINQADELAWHDSSQFDANNNLMISGEVTNTGTRTLRDLKANVTVFNDIQQVIGAGFVDISTPISAGETLPFEILLPELGDLPQNYIVNVQGIP